MAYAHEIIANQADTLVHVTSEGGFTLGRVGFDETLGFDVPSEPTNGYMVGGYVPNSEVKIPAMFSESIPGVVRAMAKKFAAEIQLGDVFIGGWYNSNDNMWYIDLSERFASYHDAMVVASERDEFAVWDVELGAELNVAEWENVNA